MTGAGSSAAAPIYRSWAGEYRKESGVSLAYESVGSSAGLKKIRAGETGFGASDVAPPASELARDGLALFPIAITGIAPVVHLPRGVENPVRLSGDVLARIFLGGVAPDLRVAAADGGTRAVPRGRLSAEGEIRLGRIEDV